MKLKHVAATVAVGAIIGGGVFAQGGKEVVAQGGKEIVAQGGNQPPVVKMPKDITIGK